MTTTIYASEAARVAAFAVARGAYQRSLLEGVARWSDRGGGGKQASSRRALLERLAAIGLTVEFRAEEGVPANRARKIAHIGHATGA